jgi:histidinol-phosphate aminotransferase
MSKIKESQMLTRRQFAAASATILTEAALAQRAAITGAIPKDTVWLNANENPEGVPRPALEAMLKALPDAWRYNYQQFQEFYATVARSEGLEREQVLIGAGSSEVLQCALHALTGPDRPLIAMSPTYEGPLAVAEALGRKVIRVPLNATYAADVKKMVEAADQAGGGLLYLCNPNNPTSAVTSKDDIAWMVANLPRNTSILIDEAYIHFCASPNSESAIRYVREGKNVAITRTFSKIYGMAGMRVGFIAATPEAIQRMAPFRNNVISIVSARGVMAALAEKDSIIADRIARFVKVRDELTSWLRAKNLKYIEPNANFIMIELGRDVRTVAGPMISKGVAVGRPFSPLDTMMRVTIGSAPDMEKFRRVFWEVYSA